MSQQHTLGLDPAYPESHLANELDWWELLNHAEQQLILLVWDYQEMSQQWRKYEPDGLYKGVRHGALLQWNQAEALMTEQGLLESLDRMVADPRFPLYDTAMSTPEDRRFELRW